MGRTAEEWAAKVSSGCNCKERTCRHLRASIERIVTKAQAEARREALEEAARFLRRQAAVIGTTDYSARAGVIAVLLDSADYIDILATEQAGKPKCADCRKPTDAGPCPGCGKIVCQLCAEREGSFCDCVDQPAGKEGDDAGGGG